jgi:hypothetical protein
LAVLLSLPSLSFFTSGGFRGTASSQGPFALSAQTSVGCTPSPNQILQTGCQLPVLAQFEQAAVQGYLAQHNLPASNAAQVYQYGGSELRTEIRAYMLDLLLSYASQDLSQLNSQQLSAYSWLQAEVQAEETQYWAAAAKEYNLWNSNKCTYVLDADVAAQQGLEYDPTQWCYPSLGNYFATPPVPTFDYFTAVAWKKTYGTLLGANADAPILLNMQQQATNNAALYALPASFTAAAAASAAVAANIQTIQPYIYQTLDSKYLANGLSYTKASAGSYSTANSAANSSANVGKAAEAATEAEEDISAAADAGDLATGVAAVSVVAVAVFAIETAVEAGIAAVNTQNTLDQIATLPALAAQAAQNPASLATMLTTQDGYTKASTVFVAQTLPDYPNPQSDAASAPNTGEFEIVQNGNGLPNTALGYLDPSGNSNVVALRGQWFINANPQTQGFQFVGSINYVDWDGNPRFASRVGPYQFLIYRPDPLPGDSLCPASASNNNLSGAVAPSSCYAYVSNALQIKDVNGNNVTVEVIDPPTMTSATYASLTPNRSFAFPVTYTPRVNDVGCIATQSGTLPPGVFYSPFNSVFDGTPTAAATGVYHETLTMTCGGSSLISTTATVDLIVGSVSSLAITSPNQVNATVGLPVNFLVTTTGSPVPALTINPSLPSGLTFKDNGDGTASITGALPLYQNCLSFNGAPCFTVTAKNAVQTVSQGLTLNLANYPNPLTFTSPGQGNTLRFPDGSYSSYTLQTTGGRSGPIHISIYPAPGASLPSWLSLVDNGDGTATLAGTPPLSALNGSYQVIADGSWCCGLDAGLYFSVSTFAAQPAITVNPGDSLAFLAGTPGAAGVVSNIPVGQGHITLVGTLPPGLSFAEDNPNLDLCLVSSCPVMGAIGGTPAVGSGGDYKVAFQLTNATGTVTQTLDVVVYEKPELASSNRIIFYSGIPATAVVSASGFPLTPIGPFSDGVGYSAGATFSSTSPLPSFLKLVSGLAGSPNGTASLTSSAAYSNVGHYSVELNIQEQAASTPAVTNAATQLANTVSLDVYVVPPGDVNLDYRTDCRDLTAVKAGFGAVRGTAAYNSALDVNGDGIVNIKDLAWVASKMSPQTKCAQ